MQDSTKEVPIQGITAEEVLTLWQEGRLRVVGRKVTDSKQVVIDKVRAYVARIEGLLTHRFKQSIDELWNDIFQCELLMEVLMPKPKARKCKDFDKYGVMRIVGVLRERGVYEQRSDPFFDSLLEEQGKDSSYRRYLGQGLEMRSQLLALKRIVEQYEKK